jgi:hypothetical protein
MSFQDFLAARTRLHGVLDQLARVHVDIGADERARHLTQAGVNLESDAFRLMVVGEFKRGKSTLINALLGESVLPARVAPCTALITEVKWGPVAEAILYPVDGEAMKVPIERLRDYVVIQDEDEVEPRPPLYRRIEVFHPLPLLQNNVQIVDSPGLNEHRVRNDIALDYLPNADALLMILSCEQALSQSELTFLDEQVSGRGLRHVFFIWNRFDAIIDSPADVADVHARSAKHLAPRLGADNRIFYVTARDAVLGKRGKPELLERSGVPAFEAALEQFLAVERGRVKMSTPLRAAENAVREALGQHIPRRESLLAEPVEAIRKRYEAQKPRLEALQQQREQLLRIVERRQTALGREATASYQNLVARLCEELPAEAAKVDVSVAQTVTRDAQKRIAAALQTWLEGRIEVWRSSELQPLIDRHLSALEADLNERLKSFLRELDAIRQALVPDVTIELADADVPPLNRLFSAIGGFFAGGLGAAVEGGTFTFDQVMKGLGLHAAVALGLLAAGFGGPVILGATLALGVVRTVIEGSSAVDRLRRRVADQVAAGLRAQIPTVSAAMEARLAGHFAELGRALDESMRIHVEEVGAQVRQILAEKEQGEAKLAAERVRLEAVRRELLDIARVIDGLKVELGGV